jgi:hypothetical protein
VVGVTAGNVDQVDEFSKLECRDKFAVAADPGAKVAAEYKTLMQMNGKTAVLRRTAIRPGRQNAYRPEPGWISKTMACFSHVWRFRR